MHILLISDTYKLVDGVSMHVGQEEEYFKSKGHKVTVVSTCTRYTTNYYVRRYKPYYQSFDANPMTLFHELRQEGPFDVIYSQCLQPQGLYFTMYLSSKFGIPVVNRFHSYVPDYIEYAYPINANIVVKHTLKNTLMNSLRKSFKYPRKILLNVPSQKMTDFLTDELNVPKDMIEVNHIPVKLQTMRSHQVKDFGKKSGEYIFLSVGRITREKNFPYLVDLWNSYISKEYPNAVWHVIGKGPELEIMKQHVVAKERVKFFGALPHDEVLVEMQKSDLLIHSSLSETFGLVIAESKSCGLPIVALEDKGGVAAQFESGTVGGYLIETKEEFCSSIDRILGDESLYEQISEKSRQDIEKNYSTNEYDKLLALFEAEAKEPVSKKQKSEMAFISNFIRTILWHIPKNMLRIYEKVSD